MTINMSFVCVCTCNEAGAVVHNLYSPDLTLPVEKVKAVKKG